ncbi:PRC-barrel domain-containing protein [Saccharothrix australiensis]|uniref:PRC-barrel domain protein n=1 Tax=Saccharothrix australiensis TaxID=2072 RepID=A0A495WAV0_9PSEU|nr:PRC-barrel domain-containing protein [Saccharothrix australiensis]RKT56938.1 PRC-barrel domain protein [Saccharothrix australiensis]
MDRTAVDLLYDCELLDRHGEPIGPVVELWLDDGRPLWAAVRVDGVTTLVPIRGAQVRDRRLVVPVARQEIAEAPRVGAELSEVEHVELHDHYGLSVPAQRLVRHVRHSGTPSRQRTP